MSDVKLGTDPTEFDSRDAIHVAVVPAIAAIMLEPGQRVGFDGEKATPYAEIIGIVDPYRMCHVEAGKRFWLFLLPNTVTGMRHHWSHPSFPDNEQKPKWTKDESEQWLHTFAKHADCPEFNVLIAAAVGEPINSVDEEYYGTYENDGEYLYFSGRDAHGEIPPEFWDHVENFTGKKCPKRAEYFSCSC